MILNMNPEGLIDLITGVVILITALITYTSPKTKKIISLFYIRLGIISMGIFIICEAVSSLFLIEYLSVVSMFFVILSLIFIIMGVNYTLKESYMSLGLLIAIAASSLLIYLAFQPGVVKIVNSNNYMTVRWQGLFSLIGDGLVLYLIGYIFYWGIKTWLNAPFLIKKEANFFFLGIIIFCPITSIFYILIYINGLMLIIADVCLIIGLVIFIIATEREPKLLYILPFKIHRIIVKDRQGFPLFDHDWSESKITEKIFTGFINAVQLMSEEVMNIGGLLDINLQKGILIVYESDNLTVGLVSSKSSKLLRDSVVKFTRDFESKFKTQLEKSIHDMEKYETASELIEKYFSNFPFHVISSRKQPLLLSSKYLKKVGEFDNKLKELFPDEKEYENIKNELQKTPIGIFPEFLSLYDDLKVEIDKIEDSKDTKVDQLNLKN
ncbi:MAG: hypothetical protein ACTSPN_03280 [Promethearchaeota archaeon]